MLPIALAARALQAYARTSCEPRLAVIRNAASSGRHAPPATCSTPACSRAGKRRSHTPSSALIPTSIVAAATMSSAIADDHHPTSHAVIRAETRSCSTILFPPFPLPPFNNLARRACACRSTSRAPPGQLQILFASTSLDSIS